MGHMSIVRVRGLQMPDTRTVGAVETGTLEGRPVLVFHPTPCWRSR